MGLCNPTKQWGIDSVRTQLSLLPADLVVVVVFFVGFEVGKGRERPMQRVSVCKRRAASDRNGANNHAHCCIQQRRCMIQRTTTLPSVTIMLQTTVQYAPAALPDPSAVQVELSRDKSLMRPSPCKAHSDGGSCCRLTPGFYHRIGKRAGHRLSVCPFEPAVGRCLCSNCARRDAV